MTPDILENLPPHLRSRVHPVASSDRHQRPSGGGGAFVLYWMRTAARGHENPALDVSALVAAALDLPFFVFQGLSEGYPYASDRHHRFALEGTRDVARELADRGVGHAFHLERPGHRGTPLRDLAGQAALVVTEDMPVRPFAAWTRSLSEHARVWAVDTACLAPMREVPRNATDRAFRFRKATEKIRREWLANPWPEVPIEGSGFLPRLSFEPVLIQDADDAELSRLISECEIDHSVGPVPHTPGGRRAGYARWRAFRSAGLKDYARHRNDPLRSGVSRMSAYLHYGHVSPFRIAREAAETGGAGAEKYLDELLVWRELPYAFCAQHPDHETLSALPDWARDTLDAHGEDLREEFSWERLARGKTGDRLWDAAQRSLLAHGELHNNVRMTWGKAILGWSRDAEQALIRMIDLNHRYALDGRDPASYGGILWCLGQFDRPFKPPQPLFGTVRTRSTSQHGRRLDVSEYDRRVRLAAWQDAPTVGIIGAGLSGLMAARVLQNHGLSVTVLDKGRRPGGRANTREHGPFRFDHGAQFFTVRDPVVQRFLESWIHEGVVAEWAGSLARIDSDGVRPAKPSVRYVGVPGMISLAEHLARDVEVRVGSRVTTLERTGDSWILRGEHAQDLGQFDQVIVAVPAPQAAELLLPAPALRSRAAEVGMAPCWAGMYVFQEPLGLDFDGAFLTDGPVSWVAHDSSKPGRPSAESWVVHAGPDWSREHEASDPDTVATALLELVESSFGPLPDVAFQRAHRWAYALASNPVPGGALFDPDLGLGACGDWCRGGRVEGALLSGIAMASRIMGQAPAAPANPLGTGKLGG